MSYLVYNGKRVISSAAGGKYVAMTVPPEIPFILMHTEYIGNNRIKLRGTGSTSVDWGEGDVSTLTLTTGNDSTFFYTYTEPRDVSINNVENITNIDTYYGNDITTLHIPKTATSLENLELKDNLLSSFTIHPEWTNLQYLQLQGNQLTTLNIPGTLTLLYNMFLGYNSLSSLMLNSGLSSLHELNAPNNSLTSISLPSGLTNLSLLILDNNTLTDFVIPADCTALTFLSLINNAITSVSSINNILIKLDNSGLSNGYLYLNGGTNAIPASAGLAAKSSLESKGWTVIVNS